MGLQKVGSVYCWADQAFIPQLFTQLLSDDLDLLSVCVHVSACSLVHVSVCAVLFAGWFGL